MSEKNNAKNTNSTQKEAPPKKAGKGNLLPVIALVAVVAAAAAILIPRFTGSKTSGGDTVVLKQGDSLVIPTSQVTEEAVFFPVEVDGTQMEVFAVRASDGTIRTAFNTCQSCYTSGQGFYRMEGGDLVCNNCGFHFSGDEVEVSAGGCNPWPIFAENKTETEEEISISYEFLSASKDIFSNWSKS